ncbi:L-2-amino-thiazoline-4-carboxylic acid hydrolase [Georgenia sp. Marseille-Q6866]
MPSRVHVPRRRWWRRALVARYGVRGRELARAVDAEYSALLARRPPWGEESRALRFHVRQAILPDLAAYRVLSREHGDAAVARGVVRDLMTAQLLAVLRVVRVLDRVGVPFGRLRRVTRRLVPRAFPPAGFTIGWGQDDEAGLRFDVTTCFYLRVLRHYAAPELTGVFCYGDQVVLEQMPRSVRLTRTGALATGAARCDFLLQPVRPAGRETMAP